MWSVNLPRRRGVSGVLMNVNEMVLRCPSFCWRRVVFFFFFLGVGGSPSMRYMCFGVVVQHTMVRGPYPRKK